jgi:integrase
MGIVYRVWDQARRAALTDDEYHSPLAKRPYDLRHAAVSLWLNTGVPATQVAEWAGHSVNVLLRVSASCIVGQDEASRRRVELALSAPDGIHTGQGPSDGTETSPPVPHWQP